MPNQCQTVFQCKVEKLEPKVSPFYIPDDAFNCDRIGLWTQSVFNFNLRLRRKRDFARQRKSTFRNLVSAAKDRLFAPTQTNIKLKRPSCKGAPVTFAALQGGRRFGFAAIAHETGMEVEQ